VSVQELTFLPRFPFSFSGIVLFGLLLVAGFVAGELVKRFIALPKITGYVLLGVLIGPAVLGWFDRHLIAESRVFVDIAFGIVLFETGRYLDLRWFRHNPWLVTAGVAAGLLAFALVFAMLILLGVGILLAAIIAAIAMSTSPAVVLMVVRDLRAEGQMTERAVAILAINCVMAFLAVTMLVPALHVEHSASWMVTLLHPAYLLFGSLGIGVFAALLLIVLSKVVGPRQSRQFVVIVGLILLAVGVAQVLKLSVLIALLTLGAVSRNLDRLNLQEVDLLGTGRLFIIVLFVVVGASLQFDSILTGGLIAVLLIITRWCGKALALVMLASVSGLTWQKALWLSVALLPMSGTALVMAQDFANLYPAIGAELSAILFAVVAILELLGPLAVQFALHFARETLPGKED
jgi:Kef-type K+ transport system membrane component KefB